MNDSFYVLGACVCMFLYVFVGIHTDAILPFSEICMDVYWLSILVLHVEPKAPDILFSLPTEVYSTWAPENKTNKNKDPIFSFCGIVSSFLPLSLISKVSQFTACMVQEGEKRIKIL